jgi:hypothetical protein
MLSTVPLGMPRMIDIDYSTIYLSELHKRGGRNLSFGKLVGASPPVLEV